MDRVIEEMAKAKGDVEKRYREKLPQIIRECMAFAYLGKSFRFDANSELDNRVNQSLIELSDEILADIETRAKKVIKYAEEEDDEDAILAYMKREQDGEDLITRIDKHNSNFRYFLEGWIAIGMVNGLSQTDLLSNIFRYMHNVYVSDLWNDALLQGYLSDSIRTKGYQFGKGILRNPMEALSELEKNSINRAYQYGRYLKFQKDGAIGYIIHRNSSFDCPYCDSFTNIIHAFKGNLLPLHPRCVCYSTPVFASDNSSLFFVNNLELYRRNLKEYALLEKDKNYHDVAQGKYNAAVTAIHNKHKIRTGKKEHRYFEENLTSSQLEVKCQEESARMGHSLVLVSEGEIGADGNTKTALDAYADWRRADIKSITTNGRNTVRNALYDKSDQIFSFNNTYPGANTDTVILYFHDPKMFDKKHVIWSWHQACFRNGKPVPNHIRKIICVVRGAEDWIELNF